MTYAAGTIVLCERGEYSDFGYCAELVTLCDCDFPALAEEFKAKFKKDDDWDSPSPERFVAWLVMTQKCAPLECQTVHIGTYGRLEIDAR